MQQDQQQSEPRHAARRRLAALQSPALFDIPEEVLQRVFALAGSLGELRTVCHDFSRCIARAASTVSVTARASDIMGALDAFPRASHITIDFRECVGSSVPMMQSHLKRVSGSVSSEGAIDSSDSELDDKLPDGAAITASHIQLQHTSSRECSPDAPSAQNAPLWATSTTDLPEAPQPAELQPSGRNSNSNTFNKLAAGRDNGPLTVAAALDAVAGARPPSPGRPIISLTLLNLSTAVPPPTDPTIQQLSSSLTSLRLHDTSHRKAAEEGAVNLLLQPTASMPQTIPSQPPAATTRAPDAATTLSSASSSFCCSASVSAVQTQTTTNDVRSRGQAMVHLALATPHLRTLSLTSAAFPAEAVRQLSSLTHLEELSLYGSLECEGGGRQAVSVQRALLTSLPRLRTLRLPMSLQAPRRYSAAGEPLLYDSDDEDDWYRSGGGGAGGDEPCWDSPVGPPAPAAGAKGASPAPRAVSSWAGVISPVAPAASAAAAAAGGGGAAAGAGCGGGGCSSWTLPPHISPAGLRRATSRALLPPFPNDTAAPAAAAALRATVSASSPALPPAPLLSPLPPMPALPSLSSLALSSNGGGTRTTLATSRSGTTSSSWSSLGGLTHTTSRLSSGLLLSPAGPQPHPRASNSNTTSSLPPAPHWSISPAAAAASLSAVAAGPLPLPSPTLPPWEAVASALASATGPLPPAATTTTTTARPSASIPTPPAFHAAPPPRAPLPSPALLPAAPALPPMPPAQPPRRSTAPSALALALANAPAPLAPAPAPHTLPPPPPPAMLNRRAWSTSQLLLCPETQPPTNGTTPNRPGWRTGSCSAPRCSFTFPPHLQDVSLPICRMNAPLFRALCDAYSPRAPAVQGASVMPRAASAPVIGAVPGLDADQGQGQNGNGNDAGRDGAGRWGAGGSLGAGARGTSDGGGDGVGGGAGGCGLRALHLPAAAGWTSWEGTFVQDEDDFLALSRLGSGLEVLHVALDPRTLGATARRAAAAAQQQQQMPAAAAAGAGPVPHVVPPSAAAGERQQLRRWFGHLKDLRGLRDIRVSEASPPLLFSARKPFTSGPFGRPPPGALSPPHGRSHSRRSTTSPSSACPSSYLASSPSELLTHWPNLDLLVFFNQVILRATPEGGQGGDGPGHGDVGAIGGDGGGGGGGARLVMAGGEECLGMLVSTPRPTHGSVMGTGGLNGGLEEQLQELQQQRVVLSVPPACPCCAGGIVGGRGGGGGSGRMGGWLGS